MQENKTDLFSNKLILNSTIPGKKLLPLWIKIFAWFYLLIGAFVPIVLGLGLIGYSPQLKIYGLESNEPFSLIGIVITTVFIIKGITAFSLLKEKDWAIKIGIVDAVVGIVICTLVMLYPIIISDGNHLLRLEHIALIPYLVTLLKIKTQWETGVRL